ncbi:MAG: ATP-binding protein, partial [Hyphomicrobium sp.]
CVKNARMLKRRIEAQIQADLQTQAAVALLGPRQVGKTTLALALADARPSIYLDLEDPADRDKLADPALYLAAHEDKLVILDEIQNAPDLFGTLRGVIDKGRRKGRKTGRFLLLGSASIDLLHQSSESLAGRIAYRELGTLDVTETGRNGEDALWLRGGFPQSYLASNDAASLGWRRDFLRTYLSRDIPALEPRVPAETLRRLWTMLAHAQGTLLNASRLATSLSVSSPTVTRYIDLLVDLLLVRRLAPYHANLGKRLVKSPKTYVRDSGVLHALLAIPSKTALYDHPIVGASWEGFVVETLINCAPAWTTPHFYRTSAGAEIDLLLELPGSKLWAIEIKRSVSPKVERGFHVACDDLKPARRFVVYAGDERVPMPHDVEAVGLHALADELTGMT